MGGGRGCGGTRGGGASRHPKGTHQGARERKTAAPIGVAVGCARDSWVVTLIAALVIPVILDVLVNR